MDRDRMGRLMDRRVDGKRHRLALIFPGGWSRSSPLKQISRGYGFVTDSREQRLESVRQVKPGDLIHIRVRDGKIAAQDRRQSL